MLRCCCVSVSMSAGARYAAGENNSSPEELCDIALQLRENAAGLEHMA